MEQYRLVVLDLDGTLTNNKKEITPRTKAALLRYQEQGGRIVLASAGPPTACGRWQRNWSWTGTAAIFCPSTAR